MAVPAGFCTQVADSKFKRRDPKPASKIGCAFENVFLNAEISGCRVLSLRVWDTSEVPQVITRYVNPIHALYAVYTDALSLSLYIYIITYADR